MGTGLHHAVSFVHGIVHSELTALSAVLLGARSEGEVNLLHDVDNAKEREQLDVPDVLRDN